MNTALLVMYILAAISLLWASHKHGQPKNENYNFWISVANNLLWLTLVWWALGWRFA